MADLPALGFFAQPGVAGRRAARLRVSPASHAPSAASPLAGLSPTALLAACANGSVVAARVASGALRLLDVVGVLHSAASATPALVELAASGVGHLALAAREQPQRSDGLHEERSAEPDEGVGFGRHTRALMEARAVQSLGCALAAHARGRSVVLVACWALEALMAHCTEARRVFLTECSAELSSGAGDDAASADGGAEVRRVAVAVHRDGAALLQDVQLLYHSTGSVAAQRSWGCLPARAQSGSETGVDDTRAPLDAAVLAATAAVHQLAALSRLPARPRALAVALAPALAACVTGAGYSPAYVLALARRAMRRREAAAAVVHARGGSPDAQRGRVAPAPTLPSAAADTGATVILEAPPPSLAAPGRAAYTGRQRREGGGRRLIIFGARGSAREAALPPS